MCNTFRTVAYVYIDLGFLLLENKQVTLWTKLIQISFFLIPSSKFIGLMCHFIRDFPQF